MRLIRNPLLYLLAACLLAALLFAASQANAQKATGHVYAVVCEAVRLSNGFTAFSCGEPIPQVMAVVDGGSND